MQDYSQIGCAKCTIALVQPAKIVVSQLWLTAAVWWFSLFEKSLERRASRFCVPPTREALLVACDRNVVCHRTGLRPATTAHLGRQAGRAARSTGVSSEGSESLAKRFVLWILSPE